ncbi:alkaline phosphatase D family protein [Phenylobacterium deserti]|uniref:Alkaline phosphatase family protein n=1 Tax=Phenylobacterium deserti TaxID=1914756 RepID=A0A328ADF1_9CAUL|nr:alkaline phosphatase D family protein [Phenylobacterium deserti]RAK52670.1 hypothetical protein DJ018_10750 [Phenylobacterium deserti]
MALRRRTLIGSALGAALPGGAAGQSNIDWRGIPRLMQGPVLGPCGPDEASIWTRSSGPFATAIEFAPDPGFSGSRRTTPRTARRGEDFVLVHRLEGLQPATTYHYRVLVDGRPNPDDAGHEPFRLTTAPVLPSRFRLAFGSCARRARYPVQPIWRAIEAARPDLFVWAGDAVYADTPEPEILAEEYRRQRDLPEIRRFMATTPQLAIWDDHDYGLNDHDRRHPGKVEALNTFRRYWPNPELGVQNALGAFFRWSYGGVDFFFLDVRFHRDPNDQPDGPSKTMLGAVQRRWLLDGLAASRATFKVLVSGSGWNDSKPEGADSWASYTFERDLILNEITRRGVTGVLLLSGDTHYGELNCLPWSERGGYDLYELVSSPLAQDTVDLYLAARPILRVRQAFSGDVNFGLLDFDLAPPDPTVGLELRDEGGHAVWPPVQLRASELTPGRKTWPQKIDALSRERWNRAQAGRAYY